MQRVVFQSYRTSNRPEFIQRCLDSVSSWASSEGLDYRFYGDELFDRVPEWIKYKCGRLVLPMSDFGRLVVARELLDEGFDRALWIDADVVVFDPESMTIPWAEQVAFTREVWIGVDAQRRPTTHFNIANAATLFGPDQRTIEFLLERHERFARQARRLDKLDFGTRPLTAFAKEAAWAEITSVGMASGAVLHDLSTGGGAFALALARESGKPLGALNLCGSLDGVSSHGFTVDNGVYLQAIDRLIASRGEVLVAG